MYESECRRQATKEDDEDEVDQDEERKTKMHTYQRMQEKASKENITLCFHLMYHHLLG